MKRIRYFLFAVAAVFSFSLQNAYADDDDQETGHERTLRERDFEALREFLKTKETVVVEKKEDNLSISGDVRFEWQHLTETENGIRLRGPGAKHKGPLPVSRNDFDVEFNLKIDYTYEKAWAMAQLQFDNGCGVGDNGHGCFDDPEGCFGSGTKDRLNLKRAYIGYNVCKEGDERFDIEVGRRKMFDLFDSIIQFDSRFDGIVLKYTNAVPIGEWYWYFGGFLIDERVDQFGYVTEIGLLDICKTGMYVEYSFIDWLRYGKNRCGVRFARGWQFQNSQITIGCHLDPCYLGRPVEIYGAFLVNHAARRRPQTNFHKKNIGWYVGALIGEIDKEGDWSFEINYELVQVQAVSDCDSAGIGRGNILDQAFTEPVRRGNANYKGINAEFLYAITDNLMIDTTFNFSTAEDNKIGGSHRYSCFEVEAIYAF